MTPPKGAGAKHGDAGTEKREGAKAANKSPADAQDPPQFEAAALRTLQKTLDLGQGGRRAVRQGVLVHVLASKNGAVQFSGQVFFCAGRQPSLLMGME